MAKKTTPKASSKKNKLKALTCGYGGSDATYHKIIHPVDDDADWPRAADLVNTHGGKKKRFYIIPVEWKYPHRDGGGGAIGLNDPPPKKSPNSATYTINSDGTIGD